MGAVIATNISSFVAVSALVLIGFYSFPVPLELRRLIIVAVVGVTLCLSYLLTHAITNPNFYFINGAVLFAIPFILYRAQFFDSKEKQFIKKLMVLNGIRR